MGFAETNSMLTLCPANALLLPYAAPAATMSAATAPWAPDSMVMLRNPGPATSTAPMPSASRSAVASSSPSARGLVPAFLASCIATLVA